MPLGYGMRTGARRTAVSPEKSRLSLAFAAGMGIASLCNDAGAADMAYVGLTENTGYIVVKGDIADFDQAKLRKLLDENPGAKLAVLDSRGGRLEPALEMGRIIHDRGMWVAAFGECASACAFIWMAGTPKVVSTDTQLGFHSPYEGEEAAQVSSVGNALVGAYLNELGYGANVIAYATSAKPEDMQWLTPRDAQLLGLEVNYVEELPELLASLEKASFPQIEIAQGAPVPDTVENPASQKAPLAVPESTGSVVSGTAKPAIDVPVPTVRQAPPPKPTEQWSLAVYRNVDFWGGDKYPKGLAVESADECTAKCAGDPECKLFTYNPAQKSCYIKTRMELVVLSDNLTSGIVFKPGKGVSEAPKIKSDFKLYRGKIWRAPYRPWGQPEARTVDACLRQCVSDSDCEFLAFNSTWSSGKQCIVWWRQLTGGLRSTEKANAFRKESQAVSPEKVTDLTPLRSGVGAISDASE
jgi:hypothetical protein